ncbi:MAG: hypothetical protein F4Y86_17220, partial [Gammaproteobacteria bacterium]|nr:hypothetical protein [Gammaproteobacteria bacterium]
MVKEDDTAAVGGLTVGAKALVGAGLPSRNYATDDVTADTRAVDGIKLAIGSVTSPGTLGFNAGDRVDLTLNFVTGGTRTDEAVDAGASFGVTLVLDNAERATNAVALTATNQLGFRYTVVAGDNAKEFTLKLSNVNELRDTNGNTGLAADTNVNDAFASDAIRRVDTTGPHITQIRITNNEGTFRASQAGGSGAQAPIGFVVEFSEAVTAADASLDVIVGTSSRSAACDPITDAADQMSCSLAVVDGWLDTDGIGTPANPLRYQDIQDDLENDAAPTFAAQKFANHKVDAVLPEVDRVTLTVPSQAKAGNNVVVKVTFTENVVVVGAPGVTVSIGGTDQNAKFVKASGKEIEFRHALLDADVAGHAEGDDNEKAVSLGAVALGGATIKDAAGNDATLTYPSAVPDKTLRLLADSADKIAPRLERTTLTNRPASGKYGIGRTIDVSMLFNEPVTFATATVKLKIGTAAAVDMTQSSRGSEALHTFTSAALTDESGGISVTEITLATEGSSSVLDVASRGWINQPTAASRQEGQSHATRIGTSLQGGSASVDTTRPKITEVKLLSRPAPNVTGSDGRRYYGGGAEIWIQVTMSEDVTVDTETPPTLTMTVGNATPTATYERLLSKKNLIFRYEVVGPGTGAHIDRNGIEVQALTNHASIKDVAENECAASCEFTQWSGTQSAAHAVDGTISGDQDVPSIEEPGQTPQTVNPVGTPVVRSSTPTGGYYKTGDTITIEVPLSPPVTFTSAPQLLLNFDEGGSQRLTANERISSNGTPTPRLTFSYTVRSGDEDVDGFTGTLSGGTPTVEDGRRVSLGSISVSGIRIDALAPDLEPPLRITSSAGSDGTYIVGQHIEVTATFSEPVGRTSIGEEPELTILIGGEERTARLRSPAATAADDEYVFRYTVAAGDNGDVTIAANALDSSLQDAAGNAADDDHPAVAASTAHTVDTKAPGIVGVPVITGHDDNLFVEGSTITATVTFDEDVNVATTGSGAVKVRFNIGTGTGSEREASYVSGNGSETLTFSYEVVADDSGALSVPANAIVGDVRDDAGNVAANTAAIPVTPFIVDASEPMLVGAPAITSSPKSRGTYVAGEAITVRVSFDEEVEVTGTPRIYLTVGPRPRFAAMTGVSGADLTFAYTVRAGDTDDDGVSIAANQLRLTSGATIKDANGLSVASENGVVAHDPLPDQSDHKVDAVAPMVESVAITSAPGSGDAYLIDETIEVTVTFNEDVTTEGSPM